MGHHTFEITQKSAACAVSKGRIHKEAAVEAAFIGQGGPTVVEPVCPAAGN